MDFFIQRKFRKSNNTLKKRELYYFNVIMACDTGSTLTRITINQAFIQQMFQLAKEEGN